MIFAELQTSSTGWNGTDFTGPKTNVPLLGSSGVYIVDSRKTLANQIQDTKQYIKTLRQLHNITGFIMFQGQSFLQNHPITPFIPYDE